MRDAARVDSAGRILDVLYFGFHHGGDDAQNKNMEYWKPAVPGQETYAIPQGEWHHIAVVSDQKSLKLYIDGVLYYNRVLIMGLVEMKANKLTVGSGIWDDPTLNALIDDVALYEFALTGEPVLMLARGVDPLSSGASVPATEAPYIPEAPTAPSPASVPDDGGAVNQTILGRPAGTVYPVSYTHLARGSLVEIIRNPAVFHQQLRVCLRDAPLAGIAGEPLFRQFGQGAVQLLDLLLARRDGD